jgi:pilus assembly protein CpaF
VGGVSAIDDDVHRALVAEGAEGRPDRTRVADLVRERAPVLSLAEVASVVDRVLARMVGLGPLDPLVDDPTVTDVLLNGDGQVWVERRGRLSRTGITVAPADARHLIDRIVAPLGLRADRRSPIVDARLPDGSRVHAVLPPIAVDGPCLTIRRFRARTVDLDEFAPSGVAAFLVWAVRARCNIVVSGGTGAGKTTLLNALGRALAPSERIVTLEDTAELRLPGEHVVRLEARPSSADGIGEIRVRTLLRNALRMRPDRIIVGEVRGAEALDMLQAMNTGHEGSLSTCHANSPADALRRLETMALSDDSGLSLEAIREQLAAAVDLVVHVARRRDGRRAVVAVAEVCEPGAPERVRPLADERALRRLPSRPPRDAAAEAPSSGWCAP